MTKLIALATAVAAAIVISGCEKQQPSDQPKPEKAQAAATTPALDQTDPLVVAKAWFKAATEGDLDGLLALTDEESREEVKKEFESPYTPLSPWKTNDDQRADAPKTRLEALSRQYRGKPIDVAPAKITEKDGKKYAEVCVVLGGIGTKEENGQDSRLVLKDGKWFVTSKR